MKYISLILTTCILSSQFALSRTLADSTDKVATKKNILLIIADDLNTTLDTYGHSLVSTPNIDRLAKQGVQYNNAYCNYPVCNPSRSSFLTGVRPETIGILDNITPLQSKIGNMVSLPYLFKLNGYHTASVGKVFHGSEQHNDNKAWNEVHTFKTSELGKQGKERNITDGTLAWCHWRAAEGDDNDQRDGQVAQKAVEILKSNKENPFFLAVGFHKPHDPFVAPKKYFDQYPLNSCDPAILPPNWHPPYPHSLPAEQTVFAKFTDQDKREFLRSYYACTSFMDAQVGKVIYTLDKEGLMENTIIVFMGDHGYHLGEHGWWNKVTIYEKGHRAPLIIVDKSRPKVAGVVSTAMLEFVDLYPTLADLCKLNNVPKYLEGKSFKSVLDNPLTSFRDVVYSIVGRNGFMGRAVKTKDWRYIEWDDARQGTELYNEHADPLEYNNLSKNESYDNVQNIMKKLLDQYTDK